ncbi:MAG: hypothetical protein AB7F74_14785 [Parvibaculaceae bacterium]
MRWGIVLLAMALALPVEAAKADPLERGLSVSDPLIMRHLEAHGFRIDCLIPGVSSSDECERGTTPASIGNPFLHPPLDQVARKIKQRILEAQAESIESRGMENAKAYGFPVNFFDDPRATLALVGVVNRLDRAFRPPRIRGAKREDFCGEVRFIYRFGYVEARAGAQYASRLPLTLNVVMRSKVKETALTCAQIAQSWDRFGSVQPPGFVADADTAAAMARSLAGKDGPLGAVTRANFDRVELNMQIMRIPAAEKKDFGTHAEYLLKVFNFDSETKQFVETKLENQIDRYLGVCPVTDKKGEAVAAKALAICRGLISRNPRFKQRLASLKQFLFGARGLYDLDQGTLIIPSQYLSFSGVSVAPGGESRFRNGPINAFLGSGSQCAGKERSAFICPDELAGAVKALDRIAGRAGLIKSPRGLVARLNDMSCTGCHQTRAIAGFHFTGADTAGNMRANEILVPGSAHFFSDLPRRSAITAAIAGGTSLAKVDFSRGFSARPQMRFHEDLKGTALFDGWGAPCDTRAGGANGDQSFAQWSCAPGLACRPFMKSPNNPERGLCVSASGVEIGDTLEEGSVAWAPGHVANDVYRRDFPPYHRGGAQADPYDKAPMSTKLSPYLRQRLGDLEVAKASSYLGAQQQNWAQDKSGGFPGGMVRLRCSRNLPGSATCGKVAATGFNDCLDDPKQPLPVCFGKYVTYAGLRACDASHPCREDYICVRSALERGEPARSLKAVILNDAEGRQAPDSCGAPDASWHGRIAQGACIPPYFVLQFRADKHNRLPRSEGYLR